MGTKHFSASFYDDIDTLGDLTLSKIFASYKGHRLKYTDDVCSALGMELKAVFTSSDGISIELKKC